MNRSIRVVVAALLCFVSFTGAASAECAWVLWSRTGRDAWSNGGTVYRTYSKCWDKIQGFTGVSEEGSLADWVDWLRRLGRYRPLENTAEAQKVTPTDAGVTVCNGQSCTEWRCLPDTVVPRGPKTK